MEYGLKTIREVSWPMAVWFRTLRSTADSRKLLKINIQAMEHTDHVDHGTETTEQTDYRACGS